MGKVERREEIPFLSQSKSNFSYWKYLVSPSFSPWALDWPTLEIHGLWNI
jgi:hypothetical protein